MIVIIDRPGQLCNRLWAITPFIALSLKHKIRLYVAHFDDYSDYFENVNRFKKINIGFFNNYYSYRAFINFLKISKIKKLSKKICVYNKKIDSFKNLEYLLTRTNTINLIKAWHQPFDTAAISEYKNEIKQIFLPNKETITYVNKVLSEIKGPEDAVIGIHMRRSDYKYFMNGKYFFNDDFYKGYMSLIEKEIQKQNKNVVFLLCSDSDININNFKQFNTIKILDSSTIRDLYALSKCDYIIGPPSTFSMWASFYGDVPLKFVKNEKEQIKLSDFSPTIAQNIFENKRVLSH